MVTGDQRYMLDCPFCKASLSAREVTRVGDETLKYFCDSCKKTFTPSSRGDQTAHRCVPPSEARPGDRWICPDCGTAWRAHQTQPRDMLGTYIEWDPIAEPDKCSCKWATADTGTIFYSRIIKPDRDCPVHRR